MNDSEEMTRMKHARRFSVGRSAFTLVDLALLGAALSGASAFASTTLDTVFVGNAGNANDTTGYGAVGYSYFIGKYEVTLDQYCSFLNAVATSDTYGLYNTQMGDNVNIAGIARSGLVGSYTYSVIGSGSRPVTYVSWYDAARFVNWLQNGQPTGAQAAGTTETGAYTLNGAVSGIITRNADWTYGLPSENEWYKAAYYQPTAQGGDTDSYWLYPTAQNTVPNSRNGSTSDANSANFYRNVSPVDGVNDGYAVSGSTAYSASQNYLTDSGAFSLADSYYGTFDQGGNVAEWNDAVISGTARGLRGGSWGNFESDQRASSRLNLVPVTENGNTGFRIVVAPEPATASLFSLGMILLAWQRKRGS